MMHSFREVFSKSLLFSLVVAGLLSSSVAPFLTPAHALAAASINLWWPTAGAHVTGTQPFKAMVPGLDVTQYDMYWRVDGGAWNSMYNSYDSSAHKEAEVDLSGWKWHGSGPYAVDFSARQNGNEIATIQTSIIVDNGLPLATQAQPAPTPVPAPTVQPTTATISTPVISVSVPTSASVNIWWPTSGAHVSGTQAFKAMVPGLDVTQYDMYWRVDGGAWNSMYNSYDGSAHKEASVNFSSWTWRGSGPYVIEFSARQNGTQVSTASATIYVDNGLSASGTAAITVQTSSPSTSAQTSTVNSMPTNPSNPLSGFGFYVDPNSDAARQAQAWQSSNPSGAAAMQKLAGASTATWFGDWNSNITGDIGSLVSKAQAAGQVPVMVAYDIPQRDCGGFSSGGTNNPDGYKTWISGFAAGIGNAKAVVILEPDALAQITCLSSSDQQTRLSLLSYAVTTLKQHANTKVYIDAGHSGWTDPSTMASRLTQANVAAADGFATNVSNFETTADEANYGSAVSSHLNSKHFVIDTSRNGNGSDGQWCNPPGRAIGALPTSSTGNSLVDAFLWLKVPGESDGNCNGGPSAGSWWADYALSLVQNAH